jgi:hypothetical protein
MRFAYFLIYKILLQIMNFQNCEAKECIFADQNERFIMNKVEDLEVCIPHLFREKRFSIKTINYF